MPNMDWSKLTPLQLGRYGEYYAKMEFASYGLDIYTSEVDDHGVDFICKNKKGEFFEIQVKSIKDSTGYAFVKKSDFDINNKYQLIVILRFIEQELPYAYVIPITAWQHTSDLLRSRDYEGLKSKPEYGVNVSKKNMSLLEKYKINESLYKHIL